MQTFRSCQFVSVSMLFSLVGFAACAPQKQVPSPRATESKSSQTGETLRDESWDVVFIQGKRAGHVHSQTVELSDDDQTQVCHSQVMRLNLRRSGQPLELTISVSTTTLPTGQIRAFQSEVPLGATPVRRQGQVRGAEVFFQTIQGESITPGRAHWSSDIGGFQAVEQSLAAQPMQPGERRKLRLLQAPPLALIGQVELIADAFEPTRLLAGEFTLLKIRHLAALPEGATLETILWANRQGEVLKTATPATGEETFRVAREVALAPNSEEPIDLERDLSVPLDRPLARGHSTQRAVYEIALPNGDPARRFPHSNRQQVESLGPHRARITVVGVRPEAGTADGSPSPPKAALQPSALIQSDDPQVVALAEAIPAESDDLWTLAQGLEAAVHRLITQKDYSQVFASAGEVARSRQGDCTEHAVLLAAMCRARQIPARVAIGLVYLDDRPRMAYHMWTEVWIGGWVPLDATLGQGGIEAGHLKIADSNLVGAAAYTSLLPVLQMVGQLEIKLIASE